MRARLVQRTNGRTEESRGKILIAQDQTDVIAWQLCPQRITIKCRGNRSVAQTWQNKAFESERRLAIRWAPYSGIHYKVTLCNYITIILRNDIELSWFFEDWYTQKKFFLITSLMSLVYIFQKKLWKFYIKHMYIYICIYVYRRQFEIIIEQSNFYETR